MCKVTTKPWENKTQHHFLNKKLFYGTIIIQNRQKNILNLQNSLIITIFVVI